jgi:high-affinity iron transporter
VAILAFVLVGKGITALQEAGVINVTPIAMPRIDLLGIYPSTQSIWRKSSSLQLLLPALLTISAWVIKAVLKPPDMVINRGS